MLLFLVIKYMNGFSDDTIAFHLADPASYRELLRFQPVPADAGALDAGREPEEGEPAGARSCQPRDRVPRRGDTSIQHGRRVRIDATVTETNIHEPNDSSLVFDGVRVLSHFEPHTDIIRKDGRDTFYGHKLYLTDGDSGLITDCLIAEGNPNKLTHTLSMLRQEKIYAHMVRSS